MSQLEIKFKPEKKLSPKEKKEVESLVLEVGMKMIRTDFLNQWKVLSVHHKINIKCHQSLHIYSVYPNLLRDDINGGCFLFQDYSRHFSDSKQASCTFFNKVYNLEIK
jgi:hypothetical protein